MKFPCLLYKSPGPHQHLGMKYKYVGCADEAQFEVLSAQGWKASIEEAAAPEEEAPRKRGRPPKETS